MTKYNILLMEVNITPVGQGRTDNSEARTAFVETEQVQWETRRSPKRNKMPDNGLYCFIYAGVSTHYCLCIFCIIIFVLFV